MTLLELAKTLSREQLKQAEGCATASELLELARKENLPLTEEMAEEAIRLAHPQVGELSDNELDAVAGGKNEDKCHAANNGLTCDAAGSYTCLICPYYESGWWQ